MIDILKITPNIPSADQIYLEYDVEDTAEYVAAMKIASIRGSYGADKSHISRNWNKGIINFE